MRYAIFVIDIENNPGNPSEMAEIDAFNDELISNNQLELAIGIAASSKSLLIDNRDGKDEVLETSLFQSSEFHSGLWIMRAGSDAEALELAKRGSRACNRKVELRPIL